MTDIFISYARSTEAHAKRIAEALRALGYGVWRDDELPAHRAYADVIEERLKTADAVVVVWSADAVKSQWVRSEADRAREDGKLVQLSLDSVRLPMPFDQIQCADLTGWNGDTDAAGWRKVIDSLADLAGGHADELTPAQPPPLPTKPSIAVLPFSNLSGDPEQEYFADGMVVEIVASLSRVRSIFVIASGSGLSFKGKGLSPQEAARRLGVRYVLEGSVRKSGNRVRINVQLIDAADGSQIWTHRFEDTLDDIFALQDQVALSVAGVIEPAVREAEVRRASSRPTDNMGSYDLYLRAIALMRSYVGADLIAALDLAERAIALDPDFPAAVTLASRLHYLVDLYGWSESPEEDRARSVSLASRALRLAGDDADVLAGVAAMKAWLEDDPVAGLALAEKAVAINPGAANAWTTRGATRLLVGDLDRAAEDLESSLRLDPVGYERMANVIFMSMARFQQHRFEEALALAGDVLQRADNATALAVKAACLGHLGRIEAARTALQGYASAARHPIEIYARKVWRGPGHLELFMHGIALAGGPDLVSP